MTAAAAAFAALPPDLPFPDLASPPPVFEVDEVAAAATAAADAAAAAAAVVAAAGAAAATAVAFAAAAAFNASNLDFWHADPMCPSLPHLSQILFLC